MKYLACFIAVFLHLFVVSAISQTETITNYTIENTMHWNGTVIVDGDIVVKTGGRLVIHPGTRVLFRPGTDQNSSGRDRTRCEIIVEGVLLAKGEINNKIIFTSDSDNARMGDWYGISIMNREDVSILDYTVIEYAYTGITVKNSNPQISNSQIHFNFYAGISVEIRSKAKIVGNLITDNGYAGLICKLGAQPVLTDNLITLNQLGVVCFSGSEPNLGWLQTGADYNIGRNALIDNSDYNFYNHSKSDIKAENNSWGSASRNEISLSIYDGVDNNQYGSVDILPLIKVDFDLEEKMLLSQNTVHSADLLDTASEEPLTTPGRNITPADTAGQSAPSGRQIPSVRTGRRDTAANNAENLIAVRDKRAEPLKPVETPKKDGAVSEVPLIDYEQIFLDAFLDEHKEVINKVVPQIRDANRGLGAHGRVIIRVVVDREGRVESAKILRGLNDYYDDLSLKAARAFRFKTGTVNGVPVKFATTLFFEF